MVIIEYPHYVVEDFVHLLRSVHVFEYSHIAIVLYERRCLSIVDFKSCLYGVFLVVVSLI